MKTSLRSNFITDMLCQPNTPEHAIATITDDVTHRMLGWQTDICIWKYYICYFSSE